MSMAGDGASEIIQLGMQGIEFSMKTATSAISGVGKGVTGIGKLIYALLLKKIQKVHLSQPGLNKIDVMLEAARSMKSGLSYFHISDEAQYKEIMQQAKKFGIPLGSIVATENNAEGKKVFAGADIAYITEDSQSVEAMMKSLNLHIKVDDLPVVDGDVDISAQDVPTETAVDIKPNVEYELVIPEEGKERPSDFGVITCANISIDQNGTKTIQAVVLDVDNNKIEVSGELPDTFFDNLKGFDGPGKERRVCEALQERGFLTTKSAEGPKPGEALSGERISVKKSLEKWAEKAEKANKAAESIAKDLGNAIKGAGDIAK